MIDAAVLANRALTTSGLRTWSSITFTAEAVAREQIRTKQCRLFADRAMKRLLSSEGSPSVQAPQARSLIWLRDHGYICESVEKYSPFPDFKAKPCPVCGQRRMIPRRQDLFQCFDIIAIREHVELIQVTTGANSAARMNKMLVDSLVAPYVLKSLQGGVHVNVHSWYKNSKNRWQLTVRPVTEEIISLQTKALVATDLANGAF